MGDDVNPEKASSGTQFYIVTGKAYTPSSLMELYSAIYQSRWIRFTRNFREGISKKCT